MHLVCWCSRCFSGRAGIRLLAGDMWRRFQTPEVGAAYQVVNAGCKKALADHFTLEPVLKESEEATVTLPAGFDAQRVRITGNVAGQPPFRGTLKHHGWMTSSVRLPAVSESAGSARARTRRSRTLTGTRSAHYASLILHASCLVTPSALIWGQPTLRCLILTSRRPTPVATKQGMPVSIPQVTVCRCNRGKVVVAVIPVSSKRPGISARRVGVAMGQKTGRHNRG